MMRSQRIINKTRCLIHIMQLIMMMTHNIPFLCHINFIIPFTSINSYITITKKSTNFVCNSWNIIPIMIHHRTTHFQNNNNKNNNRIFQSSSTTRSTRTANNMILMMTSDRISSSSLNFNTTKLLSTSASTENTMIHRNNNNDDTMSSAVEDGQWYYDELNRIGNPYRSEELFPYDNSNNKDSNDNDNDHKYIKYLDSTANQSLLLNKFIDPYWEQIKLEAWNALNIELQAGTQLYQGILSQSNLLSAICTIIAHEIETELIPATAIKNLFLELILHNSATTTTKINNNNNNKYKYKDVEYLIRHDLQAVATRSPSINNAMDAVLFHNGFHALVCYRVANILWNMNRTGLAYYIQSIVSRTYSADIHPACTIGYGMYVRVGSGVVIGETATIGNDVSILEGVTLGGTGKEKGNRHPKISNGVIIYDGGAILGNIIIGEGCIITSKSIVTKALPPLAIVKGVPAKITGYRLIQNNIERIISDPLQQHLYYKYFQQWQIYENQRIFDEDQNSI